MDICAELQVKDRPGNLIKILEPVSSLGGNVINIIHDRENNFNGNIQVNLTFDIEQKDIPVLLKKWKDSDITVAKIGEYNESIHMDYMLIGKLSSSKIGSMAKEIRTKYTIESLDISMTTESEGKVVVIYSIDAPSKEILDKIDLFVYKASKKNGLAYIRGVSQ